MSELLPTLQAEDVRDGLVDYLSTTFALADEDARVALDRFLRHPERGIFKGPYVRLRLPFKPAEDRWRSTLDWYEGFPPYGHQAAAFARLSSANLSKEKPRPLPTLVTTGTGSGKTEAFLHPILDHVLRAKREGVEGIKALILYPMNALANDQARRLTELITTSPALGGVRAALYTGQSGPTRSTVTADGLITDRTAMHAEAPDILLTNYKMLDQLLLRPADQALWKQSATSLRYIVLDEFHTYDGAQGTDVAMLLRRLGLALKRNWPEAHPDIDDAARARPLGLITPIATSATLGDKGDPTLMVDFANTVFGDDFDDESIITETRLSLEDWSAGAQVSLADRGLQYRPVDAALVTELIDAVAALGEQHRDAETLTGTVFATLYSEGSKPNAAEAFADATHELMLAAAQGHPFILDLCEAASDAVSIDTLAVALFPAGLRTTESIEQRDAARESFLVAVIAALSRVRAVAGRSAASVDLHLWVRALTRLDRYAGPTVGYDWSDDGGIEERENDDPFSVEGRAKFPAIYCRHCGRSGWGVQLGPVGFDLDHSDIDIRRNHANSSARFRALIYAPREADQHEQAAADESKTEGLFWFDVQQRHLSLEPPHDEEAVQAVTDVLPVLTLMGDDADEASHNDVCPNCQKADGIRFLGSAISTLLSVSINTIFGDRHLDAIEKKALVFTDSVQDAAHRAGFVQSRSHVFSLRNAIRDAIGDGVSTLDDVAEELLRRAGDDMFLRYRLLAPDVVDRDSFSSFWSEDSARNVPARTMRLVRKRLKFDLAMEFGLQSRVGRTLELTGSVAAEVDAGPETRLEAIGRATVRDFETAGFVDDDSDGEVATVDVVRWVRGVLERMRERGSIEHEWFRKYIENNGERWHVWGGRPRGEGMPAFPKDREAPAYPRVGSTAAMKGARDSNLDQATSSQGWYAIWARKVLGVTASDGAKLTKLLFVELEKSGIILSAPIGASGAIAYQLSPSRILVAPIALVELEAARNLLECDTCQTPVPGTATVVDQLGGGPCMVARCRGTLRPVAGKANYYRGQYNDGEIRRVVAREHTSMLKDEVRLEYEDGFKAAIERPDAPNVLVATPTLEMGIDIGDLSTVFLAGLPRSVASYLQRVGRAGRLTGNALTMAFVVGRGEQLPKLGDPLSVINGEVRPPATYLNAEEILRRQYTASIVDRLAAEGLIPGVAHARDVLAKTEGTAFLATVIDDAEANAIDRLEAFLATFDHLSEWAVETLRSWSMPGVEPRMSGIASTLIASSARWNGEIENLRLRKKAIVESLPELEAAAGHPAASEDDKVAFRAAKASLGMVIRQSSDLYDEHWVGALERFGVLPNYTLLDDSVRLDVALSWIDPDSQEFQHDAITYERGAGIAINELAPGATFYAQGVEIFIDAVDLGSEGSRVQTWVFCPDCGYARDVMVPTDGDAAKGPASCPRCGSKGIADANQKFDVAELEQVSAEVRRDESTISDRRDERQRERFTVQIAADIDPANVARQWFVEGTTFGVKYLRELTIRWVNLGKVTGAGVPRMVAGEEHSPPLFRVCGACGKLDQKGDVNTAREHRPWCRYRKSKQEHARQLALSRTLTTQGVVLRLPSSVTVGDGLGLPSVSAAVQLGLREVIGGDPDHLRLVTIVEPVLGDEVNNIALLIHDAVPGGTGYLADLADQGNVHDILERAWRIVAECPCQHEGRNACHRCLLPFAPGGDLARVSRASAERHLRTILGIDEHGDVTPWIVTQIDPGSQDPESILEQWFRKVFMDRARALGATIKEIPGAWGNTIRLTLPGSKHQWALTPQPFIGKTRPDFVLEAVGGGATPLAIYTDGRAYHATTAHNRIADDASKRRYLRAQGYGVMAITWDDIKRADTGAVEPAASWFDRDLAASMVNQFGLSPSALDHVTANPITQLMDWLQDPGAAQDRWRRVAHALPMLTLPGSFVEAVISAEALIGRAADVLHGAVPAASNLPYAWQLARKSVVMVSRYSGSGDATEVVLMLDDRPSAVADTNFADAWQLWLRLSNLLGAADVTRLGEIMAISEVRNYTPQLGAVDIVVNAALSAEWAAALEFADGDERDLLSQLAVWPDMVVPAIGIEVADGIPVGIAWEIGQIAVSLGLGDGDRAELEKAGWVVVEPNVEAVVAALGTGK
ncbi:MULTISPECIES: DEAD/DEAH box helicase [unclassified Cryobacterium]|uniref:DEAD/DEAH box helicase n=1 Tax=unclassified Cryobacterium TaxID=2649013 RepID=UPI00106BAA7B|nr:MULTISPECIES: DEAD/DEAH box helicase [unclassified Cryobacterium]TFC50334.1 DEAD/DEAH box helicase [Cryobacterium sp. TMB3-1-2]TFC71932.1 DEAD/DEAH box helicase [Cryobacterium sp. TMB3-15]TFC78525.1 DEAD/DEAH box helicase [Cryobacterium sp. TMB3-10]TFD44582.1 DEAD/DEAH box helicase [Cryobacterium sp. TMB3-12]